MTDLIVILIVLLLVGAAILYICKAKKNGQKCVGCPYAKSCGSKGSCSGSQQQ